MRYWGGERGVLEWRIPSVEDEDARRLQHRELGDQGHIFLRNEVRTLGYLINR
ncbi:MAG: hypothetical protein ACREYC_04240 [Gammaproteobacteria bacterium]